MKTKTVKKVAKKAAKKVVNKPQYSVTALVMGKKYAAKGNTISEALEGLDVKNCKGKCVLSVSNGETTRERVLMPNMAFKLFSLSKMMREISIKQVSQLFF